MHSEHFFRVQVFLIHKCKMLFSIKCETNIKRPSACSHFIGRTCASVCNSRGYTLENVKDWWKYQQSSTIISDILKSTRPLEKNEINGLKALFILYILWLRVDYLQSIVCAPDPFQPFHIKQEQNIFDRIEYKLQNSQSLSLNLILFPIVRCDKTILMIIKKF